MSLYRDRGVVLRTYKLGEADRIVVLLTPGHGKVRAVAKGVRRTKSRIGGRLEPLSHVELLLYEGRELDIVSQAETIEPWRQLREDLGCLSQGLAMAEATEQVAQERESSEALYRMLVGALRALVRQPGPLVLASFYWKLLSLDGAGPMLDCCASCGAGPRPSTWSPSTSPKVGRCAETVARASRSARPPSSCSAGCWAASWPGPWPCRPVWSRARSATSPPSLWSTTWNGTCGPCTSWTSPRRTFPGRDGRRRSATAH